MKPIFYETVRDGLVPVEVVGVEADQYIPSMKIYRAMVKRETGRYVEGEIIKTTANHLVCKAGRDSAGFTLIRNADLSGYNHAHQ